MNELNSNSLIEREEALQFLQPASTSEKTLVFIITAVSIILDQFTKYIVEATLPLHRSYAPFPAIEQFFRFTHVSNKGAAFGIFQNGGQFFTIVAIFVTIFILYYNYTLPTGQTAIRLALGLQLGGALGNVIDRFRIGHVTDFLDFGPWPVFNLADTSIVAGVIILAWLTFREQQAENKAAVLAAESPTPSDTLTLNTELNSDKQPS